MHSDLKGLSIFHPAGHLKRPDNPFGKDIANAALFRALVNHGNFKEIAILNQVGLSPEQLIGEVGTSGKVSITSAALFDTSNPTNTGMLIRGQPYLAELAWLRRTSDLDMRYSIVGLIHTVAPPTIRQLIGEAALAPTHPWDALVCSSPAVKQSMEKMFENWSDHLTARLGAVKSPRPQLPLIPLAVDTELLAKQSANLQGRIELRKQLAIKDEDILVLWVGRLSYYEKAFPQSMFQAMQEAAKNSTPRLHFVLVGWFPGGNDEMLLYQEAANQLAPDINVIILDGNDAVTVSRSWAAADMFISLVDNIQETFGLTPVEAMAAGLPVIASDWDGYRYTIRDGIDGFLVPTLGSPGGAPGELLAGLMSFELETYQTYVGAIAQHTAVHIQRAAAAISLLANNPEQRIAMGLAGQRRAQTYFSWPEVIRLYKDLFADLTDRRQKANPELASAGASIDPLRGEPFTDFEHFASHILKPSMVLRLTEKFSNVDLKDRMDLRLNRMYPGLRRKDEEALKLMQSLEKSGNVGTTVSKLLKPFPIGDRPYLETTLVWLAKQGLVDWIPPSA